MDIHLHEHNVELISPEALADRPLLSSPTICLLVIEDKKPISFYEALIPYLFAQGVVWIMTWGKRAHEIEDMADYLAEFIQPPMLDLVTTSHADEQFEDVVEFLVNASSGVVEVRRWICASKEAVGEWQRIKPDDR